MSNGTNNYYDVLDVSRNASYDEIKESFHRLARAKHPDKQHRGNSSKNSNENVATGSKFTAEFRNVQKAWWVLRDSDRRIAHDADLKQTEMRIRCRNNGAMEINLEDLEEAIDDADNSTIFVYDCRCGEEIVICNWDRRQNLIMDCEGCCFVYKICGTK